MGLFSNSFREEDDYLLLNQPKPSKAVLANDTYLKYTRSPCASSDCFDWVQPLKFTVNETRTQWNELSLKSQSFTEVLKNIKNSNCLTCSVDVADECFCFDPVTVECASEDTCNPFKYSLTASNVKSDINLYTDFWEKATNVYYYAQNDFTLSATLVGAYDESQVLDTSYTTNELAARNLWNDNFTSTIAWFVNKDELVPGSDLGFFKPDVFGMSKWESTITGDGLSSVNNTLPYSGGILKKDNKQYRDIFDINGKKNDLCGYGYNDVCTFAPFSRVGNEVSLRSGCAEEYEWVNDVQYVQQDVYGNTFYLLKSGVALLSESDRNDSATGVVMVDCIDGKRYNLSDLLADSFYINQTIPLHSVINSITMGTVARVYVYYDVVVIYGSNGFVGVFQLKMDFETGIPTILPENGQYLDTLAPLALVRHVFDADSKLIYFATTESSSMILKIFVYDLEHNRLFLSDNTFTGDAVSITTLRTSGLAYCPTTEKLYYLFINSTNTTSFRNLGCVVYEKRGGRFINTDSFKIMSTIFSQPRRIVHCWVDASEQKYMALAGSNKTLNIIRF